MSDTDRKSDLTYAASENYDERLQHHTNFFNSVRTGTPVIEDAVFGFRAVALVWLIMKVIFRIRLFIGMRRK